MTFDAEFDSQGRLVPKGRTEIGLELPATDSTLFNPTGFTWKVEFDLKEVATNYTVVLPSFDIQVPLNTTVDLTLAMPVDTTPGVLTLQGPSGVTTVQHGTDANVARPNTTGVVQWVGTAKPLNALPYDWWLSL
jgi:hypothetical protein